MDPQEVNPYDDTTLTECSRCGEMKYCKLRSDPFLLEVFDETNEPSYWCEDCLESRRDDI